MNAARRLAAILAADVVGYSRLMGEDEAGTARAVATATSTVTIFNDRFTSIRDVPLHATNVQSRWTSALPCSKAEVRRPKPFTKAVTYGSTPIAF